MYKQAQACNEMTETDVREAIVRPFLEWLGYAYGTQANIRTEFPLRYSKAFLGRKNSERDPVLRGKADYICEVISCARWVVEVKAAREALTLDDSEQAHTYATHPEIAASFYLLTNGYLFKLYRVGQPQTPMLEWKQDEIATRALEIKNVLSPPAIENKVKRDTVFAGKPLCEGIGQSASLSGLVTYIDHKSNNPDVARSLENIRGMRATISKGLVSRTEKGSVRAEIQTASAFAMMDAFNQTLGITGYVFDCGDEYISTDANTPSIFQNITTLTIKRGTRIPAMLGNPASVLPFDWQLTSFTQAVGYVQGDTFTGTFFVDYQFNIPERTLLPPMVKASFGCLEMSAVGDFELKLH